jgi:regulator of sirC expression with transglutaminase-like and TPR domain
MKRHPFDLLMELAADEIRLDCAALHLSRDVYPYVDLNTYLRELDAMAETLADTRPGLAATLRYQAMREVLVGAYGFTGTQEDYYDPQNSYLCRVIDRRAGIDISLAVVWIEVGRRLKWPVSGLRFPGHFLVRFDDPERFVLADPFEDGRSLSVEDCRRILHRESNGQKRFSSKYLRPLGTRAILTRMLNNLRLIYLANQDWGRLSAVLQRLAAVEPANGRHLQDLAAIRYRQGDLRGAYAHLAACLQRFPDAEDRPTVQRSLETLERVIAAMN